MLKVSEVSIFLISKYNFATKDIYQEDNNRYFQM